MDFYDWLKEGANDSFVEDDYYDDNLTDYYMYLYNQSLYMYKENDQPFIAQLLHHRDKLVYVLAHIYPILIITGVCLNLITAIGFMRRRMQMEHHTTIYLISILLTSAYILASHFSTFTFYQFNNNRALTVSLSTWLCKIWSFTDDMLWSSVSWQYSMLLLDRFLQHAFSCWPDSACWSNASRNFCTRKSALITILTVYSFCLLLHIHVLVYYQSIAGFGVCRLIAWGEDSIRIAMLHVWMSVIYILDHIAPLLSAIFIIVVIIFFRLSKRRFAFSFTPIHLSNSESEMLEGRYTLTDLVTSALALSCKLCFLFMYMFGETNNVAMYFIFDIVALLYCLILVINPVIIIVLLPSLRDELYRVFVDQPRRVCGNCATETRNSISRRLGKVPSTSVAYSFSPNQENVNIQVDNTSG